jgi:hypothetical protein
MDRTSDAGALTADELTAVFSPAFVAGLGPDPLPELAAEATSVVAQLRSESRRHDGDDPESAAAETRPAGSRPSLHRNPRLYIDDDIAYEDPDAPLRRSPRVTRAAVEGYLAHHGGEHRAARSELYRMIATRSGWTQRAGERSRTTWTHRDGHNLLRDEWGTVVDYHHGVGLARLAVEEFAESHGCDDREASDLLEVVAEETLGHHPGPDPDDDHGVVFRRSGHRISVTGGSLIRAYAFKLYAHPDAVASFGGDRHGLLAFAHAAILDGVAVRSDATSVEHHLDDGAVTVTWEGWVVAYRAA